MDKFELASDHLKDVAQSWYKVRPDSSTLGGGPITWDLFKMNFVGQFFPRFMKEAKVEEFINLKQGSISVRD